MRPFAVAQYPHLVQNVTVILLVVYVGHDQSLFAWSYFYLPILMITVRRVSKSFDF
jgi:hypothetical protein